MSTANILNKDIDNNLSIIKITDNLLTNEYLMGNANNHNERNIYKIDGKQDLVGIIWENSDDGQWKIKYCKNKSELIQSKSIVLEKANTLIKININKNLQLNIKDSLNKREIVLRTLYNLDRDKEIINKIFINIDLKHSEDNNILFRILEFYNKKTEKTIRIIDFYIFNIIFYKFINFNQDDLNDNKVNNLKNFLNKFFKLFENRITYIKEVNNKKSYNIIFKNLETYFKYIKQIKIDIREKINIQKIKKNPINIFYIICIYFEELYLLLKKLN